jgi:hypothetical protein
MNNTQTHNTMNNTNTTKAFEAGKFYVNRQDVLNGLLSGFMVVSRTENWLTVETSFGGHHRTRKIQIQVKDGHEWARQGNGPYASAVWA